jgi:hypothetical protein
MWNLPWTPDGKMEWWNNGILGIKSGGWSDFKF